MNVAIAAIPVLGLYVIVVCYHLTSYFGSHWVREAIVGTNGTDSTWKIAFMAAAFASAVVWCIAVLYAIVYSAEAVNRSEWRNRSALVLVLIASWCIIQPIATSLTLPQAMSLLVVDADESTKSFIDLFQYSRFPGFVSGLLVAFTLALLVLSAGSASTVERLSRIRSLLKQGILIYVALVVLGAVRLAVAQRAVTLVPKDPAELATILNVELAVYATYYSMMTLMASYGAMFAFNLQTERTDLDEIPPEIRFRAKDLIVGLASLGPIVVPILRFLFEYFRNGVVSIPDGL